MSIIIALLELGRVALEEQRYTECEHLTLRSCDILREVSPTSKDMAEGECL